MRNMRNMRNADQQTDKARAQQIASDLVNRVHGGTLEEESGATYRVRLWLDNEEGTYHWSRGVVMDAITAAIAQLVAGEPFVWPIAQAAKELKDQLELGAPGLSGMYGDLLSWALASVDWFRVARDCAPDRDELHALIVAEVIEMLDAPSEEPEEEPARPLTPEQQALAELERAHAAIFTDPEPTFTLVFLSDEEIARMTRERRRADEEKEE